MKRTLVTALIFAVHFAAIPANAQDAKPRAPLGSFSLPSGGGVNGAGRAAADRAQAVIARATPVPQFQVPIEPDTEPDTDYACSSDCSHQGTSTDQE